MDAHAIVETALGCILGLFFLAAGVRKLWGWEWAKQNYLRNHPIWVYYASAVIEVVTGSGLIVPGLRFFASILQLALIFAVTFIPLRPFDRRTIIPAAVMTALLIVEAWL
ncbi:hypothetical protein HK096_007361, partial [Nowakowskiella sp. JEL0078]